MKSFALAVLAGVVAAGPQPLNKMVHSPAFMNFVALNNRHYTSPQELQERAEIFLKNDGIIRELNAKSAATGKRNAAVYEHNFLSDMRPEEREKMLGLKEFDSSDRIMNLPRFSSKDEKGRRSGRGLVAKATTIDHAADGRMTPVKNQGACGSCWAFNSNSALEGQIALATMNPPQRLSEQHLVDCSRDNASTREMFGESYKNYGCNGGWMSYAWQFQQDQGVMLDSDYPYTAKDEACKHDGSKTIGNVARWGQLKDSIDQVKEKLKTHPLAIAINASQDAFTFYKEGVIPFDASQSTRVNHGVVIVGYQDKAGEDDTDPSPQPDPEPVDEDCTVYKWWHSCEDKANDRRRLQDANGYENYWKIQNSWGKNWGDEGFVLFEIAEGKGVYGMNQYIYWVEM